MELLLAVVIGTIYGAAIYLLLRQNMVKLIVGLVLLSHGANLLIFTAAGPSRGNPPILRSDHFEPVPSTADPVPQALILTAIVISFGVLSFATVLVHRANRALGTDDLKADAMRGPVSEGE
jgi:multicomponent Na+:H+ antiporter subunit C